MNFFETKGYLSLAPYFVCAGDTNIYRARALYALKKEEEWAYVVEVSTYSLEEIKEGVQLEVICCTHEMNINPVDSGCYPTFEVDKIEKAGFKLVDVCTFY